MARRAARIQSAQHAEALRMALERGAFAPAEASRVMRAIRGLSQAEFAAQLGLNIKVIKALESGSGNPSYDSLEKLASACGLHVAFVKPTLSIGLFDPGERAEDERRRRQADARDLAAGRVSAHELDKRNAMPLEGVTFELRELE